MAKIYLSSFLNIIREESFISHIQENNDKKGPLCSKIFASPCNVNELRDKDSL